jgi:hypothetical protein
LQKLRYNLYIKAVFWGVKSPKIMVSGTERRWLLSTFIVLGVLVLFFIGSKLGSPAGAEVELQTGSNGEILVVPVQIERERYGLAMVDTVGQTLWIYELNSIGPAHSRLRLLAARSWQYDRLLKQYNTAEPTPEQVRMLLEEGDLGKRLKEQVKEKQRGLDVNTVEAAEPNE